MTLPSPSFTINGTGGTDSVSVTAGGAVVATLVDITGVAPVSWEIERTDDTGVPSDYTFVQSGSVGQTYTGTALLAGTAAVIKCTVAGGYDPTTDTYSDELVLRRKFYAPTGSGLEPLVPGETAETDYIYISSGTYGAVKPINELLRAGFVGVSGGILYAYAATIAALPAHTYNAGVITASANGTLPAIDGVAMSVGWTLLVKNEGASHLEHGLYTVTALGDAGSPFVLTRHTDFDTSVETDPGKTIYVLGGTQTKTEWRLATSPPIVLGTTALGFENTIYLARNTGEINSFGVTLIKLDSSNNVIIGEDSASIADVNINTDTGQYINLKINGGAELSVTNGQVEMLGGDFTIDGTSLRFTSSGYAIDCYNTSTVFKIKRVSQAAVPALQDSEIAIHRDTDDDNVSLLYDDPDLGALTLASTKASYGSIYLANGSTNQALTAAYAKLTGFTADGPSSSDVTTSHANDQIEAGRSGLYRVAFQASFTGIASVGYILAVAVDGTEDESIAAEVDLDAVPSKVSISATGFIQLIAGEVVSLSGKHTNLPGSNNITPSFLQLIIERLGD